MTKHVGTQPLACSSRIIITDKISRNRSITAGIICIRRLWRMGLWSLWS